QEGFVGNLGEVLPGAPGFGPPGGGRPRGGQRGGGQREDGARAGFGLGIVLGPGLFAAADADKDGWLTRAEFKATFAKWFADWDRERSGSVDEAKLRAGWDGVLPMPLWRGS